MKLHDLWCAACTLQPGLTSFQLMSGQDGRDAKALGKALVQNMLLEYMPLNNQHSATSTTCDIEPIGGTLGS